MLKVGIVDDEHIVRVGLQTFINWEEHGYELAGLFSSAGEVLDYCLSNRLDILLTDMKMPTMDGLELIKRLKKIQPETSILVLSNYDDFKLVSGSYKEGIDDYLQKQFIETQSLLDALDTISQKRIKKGLDRQGTTEDRSIRTQRYEAIKNLILFPQELDGANRDILAPLDPVFRQGNVFLLLLQPESGFPNEDNAAQASFHRLADNIAVAILETAVKYGAIDCFLLDHTCLVLMVNLPETGSNTGQTERLSDLCTAVYQTARNLFNLDLLIGVSQRVESTVRLHMAYMQAARATQYHFYTPESRVNFSTEVQLVKVTTAQEADLIRKILAILRIKDSDRLKALITDYFIRQAQEKTLSPPVLKQAVLRLLFEIEFFLIQENYADRFQDIYIDEAMMQSLLDCRSFSDLQSLTMQILEKLFRPIPRNHSQPMINATKKYVLENYMNPIGLANVSDHLRVNNSYLCRIFKERTGENLSYFISRIRVEKSITLIVDGALSTEEIAERVGFPSGNYFVRVFKKITGKTLSEFKGEMRSQSFE